jgi:5-methylcytosine-specific restriction endonuclease McrA
MTDTKVCSKCGNSCPATNEFFNKNANSAGGLTARCRKCLNEQAREYREKNRETLRAKQRDYIAKNPEREKNRKRDPVEVRERASRWYYEHKHENRVQVRLREAANRRRARKMQSSGHYTRADVELQLNAQKRRCWHCGKPLGDKYEIDHLIPLSRGGSNDARNIVISCRACNRSKGAKLPQEWNGRLF